MTDSDNALDGPNTDEDSTLEALASLPNFYHPVASPDGDRIAYYHDETGRNELYVQDVETGERTQVSDGNVPRDASYPIVWDADGDRIFFHRDQDAGDEQMDVHAITVDGETTPVVETNGQGLLWDVSSDGDFLLYSSTASGQMNLHRYVVESGESTQLTEHEQPVMHGRISPSGDHIAYRANERDDLENSDAYAMRADGSERRRLDVGAAGCETSVHGWLPDGDRLLLSDDSADMERAGVYDLRTDEVAWYGSDEYEETPQYVLPDGESFLAVRHRDCAIVPVVYDVDDPESGRELSIPEGSATLPDGPHRNGVLADGRILVSHTAPASREQLYAYDLDDDRYETVVEAEYGRFDPDAFADCEVVTYESTDGLEIEGLLYDSGERPSPAVVAVHGGPHAAEYKRFNSRFQFLVDRGYSVFLPNYRGSTGRGREFKNRVHGDWGGMEQADVAEAGRWLKHRDWIDEDRVAAFGASYGGFSVYSQLTQYPELWSNGVAWIGMTDLSLLYEDSMPHFKTAMERQLGDPEENADFYRERSPITHVDEMERPILIVHGVNDPRCPISQARTFRDALEARGWVVGEDFEYEELGEEGHGSTDIDQKIRTFRLMADFFGRRL